MCWRQPLVLRRSSAGRRRVRPHACHGWGLPTGMNGARAIAEAGSPNLPARLRPEQRHHKLIESYHHGRMAKPNVWIE